MTKAGRANMLTQQAMGWNRRKRDNLHQVLAHRYVKITERAKVEAASFSDFKKDHNLDQETIQQWVYDVRQWAVTDSNQARQRKRKRMTELKKKLREKVVQYNTGVQE
ncbi:hypothetical protein NQZ68_001065 [Dissostichus eleginoides]|nr:hypothetical protein NQZ68_001032 [Dissostichus eleginoides]KAI9517896.1 hypothetical protein NQZ68_001065 [Dissostichus eleginoides]